MTPVLSKGEFRQLPLLNTNRSPDPMGLCERRVRAVTEAYDAAIDRLIASERARDEMRKDIHELVTCMPVGGAVPKLRLILVGVMLPWMTRLFGRIAKLCKHVE